MVVTNTRFSGDAAQYGKFEFELGKLGLPQNNGLKDWIDGSGLHPVTCLTTLTQKEKQMLLDKKIVLCKTIHHNHSALQSIGIKSPRLEKVMEECEALCNEFTFHKINDMNNKIQIHFLRAAGTVTGSKHLISAFGKKYFN